MFWCNLLGAKANKKNSVAYVTVKTNDFRNDDVKKYDRGLKLPTSDQGLYSKVGFMQDFFVP